MASPAAAGGAEELESTASAWLILLEPSSLAMVFTAVATAVFASYRALSFDQIARRNRALESGMTTLQSGTALLVPLGGSVSLLLLFYFFSSLSLIVTLSVCMSSAFGIGYCLYPLAERILGAKASKEWQLPLFGSQPQLLVFLTPIACSIVFWWLCTGHWALNNVLGVSLCVAAITFIRFPNLKVAFILLGGLFFYDIFWVFYSTPIFGKNVMVTVATEAASNPVATVAQVLHLPVQPVQRLQLPVKLIFPHDLIAALISMDMYAAAKGGFMMLGLGDIAIPGMLLAFTYRFDFHMPRRAQPGYFLWAVEGYAIGLIISLAASLVYRVAQPALLYLVPCTLIPVFMLGWVRGQVSDLWDGSCLPSSGGDDDDAVRQDLV